VRALRLAALRSDPLAFGSTFAKDAAREPSYWIDLVRRNAEGGNEALWVAERTGGALVGMIGAFPHDGVHYVWGMWVDPAHRSTGLGGRLLDRLIDWAVGEDARRVLRLDVNPAQRAASQLYRSRGFVGTGRHKPLAHAPEVLLDEMELRPTGGSPRVPGH